MSERENEAGESLSRRAALKLFLALSGVGTALVSVFPVFRYLRPPPQTAAPGEVTLSDAEKSKIKASAFSIIKVGRFRVIVFRDARGTLFALSAKCTHEGCTVTWKKDEGLIWCACHNGKFDTSGRVLSGPPPRPLQQFKVTGTLDGEVTVGPETA